MRSIDVATFTTLTVLLGASQVRAAPPSASFGAYWHRGEAEITSYDLQQARYGELHEGHAVLIYVTEPFSKKKQVKLDDARAAGSDAVPMLKVNFTRKFATGIYPYSMMTSVFSPIAGDPATKVTTTSQEWCGHTFFQLNRGDRGYGGHLYSYFESEGDRKLDVPGDLLEDELWTRIRLDPASLPSGEIELLPGATHLRLRHLEAKLQTAKASVEDGPNGTRIFRLKYTTIDRELAITFSRAFPYTIEGWTETYVSGWGGGAKRLTTKATKKKRLMSDYWNRKSNVDRKLRRDLGLPD